MASFWKMNPDAEAVVISLQTRWLTSLSFSSVKKTTRRNNNNNQKAIQNEFGVQHRRHWKIEQRIKIERNSKDLTAKWKSIGSKSSSIFACNAPHIVVIDCRYWVQ